MANLPTPLAYYQGMMKTGPSKPRWNTRGICNETTGWSPQALVTWNSGMLQPRRNVLLFSDLDSSANLAVYNFPYYTETSPPKFGSYAHVTKKILLEESAVVTEFNGKIPRTINVNFTWKHIEELLSSLLHNARTVVEGRHNQSFTPLILIQSLVIGNVSGISSLERHFNNLKSFFLRTSVASDSLETEVPKREGDSQLHGMGTWYWKTLAYRQVTPDLGTKCETTISCRFLRCFGLRVIYHSKAPRNPIPGTTFLISSSVNSQSEIVDGKSYEEYFVHSSTYVGKAEWIDNAFVRSQCCRRDLRVQFQGDADLDTDIRIQIPGDQSLGVGKRSVDPTGGLSER
ncbi:hypothetical protein EDD85DRAFT_984117 [Armillaria nabsnona]|nr:hypothetical protein EDD85DRAFT_984117 [Armillaria nabsnona]